MSKLIDQLRQAVKGSGRSLNSLGRETGIAVSGLSRLMSGECGLGADNAEKLAEALGYEIVMKRILKKRSK